MLYSADFPCTHSPICITVAYITCQGASAAARTGNPLIFYIYDWKKNHTNITLAKCYVGKMLLGNMLYRRMSTRQNVTHSIQFSILWSVYVHILALALALKYGNSYQHSPPFLAWGVCFEYKSPLPIFLGLAYRVPENTRNAEFLTSYMRPYK